jgi:hypothetical protein
MIPAATMERFTTATVVMIGPDTYNLPFTRFGLTSRIPVVA